MDQYLMFHQGELAVQAMANESDIAKRNGAVLSGSILPGAIPFIAQQNMLVVSSMDAKGQLWTSVLFGNQGFIQASQHDALMLDKTKLVLNEDDPFWRNIEHNQQIGVLAIELSTRRRFRMNGRIQALELKGEVNGEIEVTSPYLYEVKIQQAYPNCPKFIQRRNLKLDPCAFSEQLPSSLYGTGLKQQQQDIIQRADSFFVSSASPVQAEGVEQASFSLDASHRGGLPGFIKFMAPDKLLIPDYKGNSMFNTLGNIHLYPKAGIIIPDFDNARLLHLTGEAEILWDQEDTSNQSAGTHRFWVLKVTSWQQSAIPQGVQWYFQDYSPHNPREKVTQNKVQRDPNKAMYMRVANVVQKSSRIKLFRLIGAEAELQGKHREAPLPEFEAGAHLPIEVTLANGQKVMRYYSILSSVEERDFYDIAVQREDTGKGGSKVIHETLDVGVQVKVLPPRSEFPLLADQHHKVIIAGGIGITPMLSMLREVIKSHASFEFHYTARSEADLAFKEEVMALAGDRAFFYTSNAEKAKRLDLEYLIQQVKTQSHVYMCGPLGLINQVRELTKAHGWADSRVHFESFGNANQPGDKGFEVRLKKSNQVFMVDPKETILDVLNQHNVSVPFDCKRGECGMCATTLLIGEADHRDLYLTKTEQAHQICVCVSRAKGGSLTLDL